MNENNTFEVYMDGMDSNANIDNVKLAKLNDRQVLNGSLWDDDCYVADVSSRYFGECYVGMMHGKPVCRGGFYRVVNEMLERRKNG